MKNITDKLKNHLLFFFLFFQRHSYHIRVKLQLLSEGMAGFGKQIVGCPSGAPSLVPSLSFVFSLLQKVLPHHHPSTCETEALLLRSLLIGQQALWHPPRHPVWVDCPSGAR